MAEILTESFCERCGTKYTFEAGEGAKPGPMRGVRALARGLRTYVLTDESLDEALGEARRDQERESANRQLDAFHQTFSFCIECRQYTCKDCWNDAAGLCQSCAPLPEELRAPPAAIAPAAADAVAARAALGAAAGSPPALEAGVAPPDEAVEIEVEPVSPERLAAFVGSVDQEAATVPGSPLATGETAAEEAAASASPVLAAEEVEREAEGTRLLHGAEVAAAASLVASGPELGGFQPTLVPTPEAPAAAAAEATGPELAPVAESEAPVVVPAAAESEAPAAAAAESEAPAHIAAAAAAAVLAASAAAGASAVSASAAPAGSSPQVPPTAVTLDAAAVAASTPPAPPPAPAWQMVAPDDQAAAAGHKPPAQVIPAAAAIAAAEGAAPGWPAAGSAASPASGATGAAATPVPRALPAATEGAVWPSGYAAASPTTPQAQDRPGTPAPVMPAVWDVSSRDVLGRPGSGVQSCVTCGLPLSATARFCRRCGSRQG